MENSKGNKTSIFTKVLVKKIHGGRKQDSKFWQSEYGKEGTPGKRKRGPSVFLQIMVLVAGALVGCAIMFVYFEFNYEHDSILQLPQNIISSVRKHFPPKNVLVDIEPHSTPLPKTDYKEPETKEFKFSDEQVRKEMEKLVLEKKHQQPTSKNTSEEPAEVKYEYEVELYNGGWVYTDNAKIKGDKITYTNGNGLVVSINRDEIKSIKRTKINK